MVAEKDLFFILWLCVGRDYPTEAGRRRHGWGHERRKIPSVFPNGETKRVPSVADFQRRRREGEQGTLRLDQMVITPRRRWRWPTTATRTNHIAAAWTVDVTTWCDGRRHDGNPVFGILLDARCIGRSISNAFQVSHMYIALALSWNELHCWNFLHGIQGGNWLSRIRDSINVVLMWVREDPWKKESYMWSCSNEEGTQGKEPFNAQQPSPMTESHVRLGQTKPPSCLHMTLSISAI